MGSNPEAIKNNSNMQIDENLEEINQEIEEFKENIGKSIQKQTIKSSSSLLQLQMMHHNIVCKNK